MKIGVVTMANGGNSANAGFPTNDIEQLDNSDGNSWLTIENRGIIPIGVSPAWGKGSASIQPGFTCPALCRTTVPIDPTNDVQLSSQFPSLPNDDAGFFQKQYFYPLPVISSGQGFARAANIIWCLHDDGSPNITPLYPIESWVPTAIGDLSPIQANTNSRAAIAYCGTNFTSTGQFTSEQYLGGGNPDSVLMAVSWTLKDATVPSGMLIVAELFGQYVSGASPSYNMMSDLVLFTPADPIGTVITARVSGAQWVRTKFINFAGTEALTLGVMAWMGVPAN